jgi:hypothetical protein
LAGNKFSEKKENEYEIHANNIKSQYPFRVIENVFSICENPY